MKLAYFSYPFSDNPDRRTDEAVNIAFQICRIYNDLFPVVPHLTFNSLWPKGKEVDVARNLKILQAELEMIKRCDLFIVGMDRLSEMSTGMFWELAYALLLGKEILQVVFDPAGEDDEVMALKEPKIL